MYNNVIIIIIISLWTEKQARMSNVWLSLCYGSAPNHPSKKYMLLDPRRTMIRRSQSESKRKKDDFSSTCTRNTRVNGKRCQRKHSSDSIRYYMDRKCMQKQSELAACTVAAYTHIEWSMLQSHCKRKARTAHTRQRPKQQQQQQR